MKIGRAVQGELAAWELWLSAGRLALQRNRRRRPHALISLSRVVRLLELGFDLARLACGPDSDPKEPDPYRQAIADLKRAYGDG